MCRKEMRVTLVLRSAEAVSAIEKRPRKGVEPYRFRSLERRLANAGRGLGDTDLTEMDTLWDEAKVQGY